MWLNQQTLDAIKMMSALTRSWPAFVRAADLAPKTGVSLTNIHKTAHVLGQAGLVETVRGPHGGLRLARVASHIAVSEIVRAFEPKDCPANFLMPGAGEAISALLFEAHRGFFQPLEAAKLLELGDLGSMR